MGNPATFRGAGRQRGDASRFSKLWATSICGCYWTRRWHEPLRQIGMVICTRCPSSLGGGPPFGLLDPFHVGGIFFATGLQATAPKVRGRSSSLARSQAALVRGLALVPSDVPE